MIAANSVSSFPTFITNKSKVAELLLASTFISIELRYHFFVLINYLWCMCVEQMAESSRMLKISQTARWLRLFQFASLTCQSDTPVLYTPTCQHVYFIQSCGRSCTDILKNVFLFIYFENMIVLSFNELRESVSCRMSIMTQSWPTELGTSTRKV